MKSQDVALKIGQKVPNQPGLWVSQNFVLMLLVSIDSICKFEELVYL
jgi:hypothetical protein